MSKLDCPAFPSVPEMLASLRPRQPVYCIFPEKYRNTAREFLEGFPGRVLYAVKVNDDPRVLKLLFEAGVRHFVVDHVDGLETLKTEIPIEKCVVFVRMAVHHRSALNDLSTKFGAPPGEMPGLMQAVAESGAETALAFNVGSAVTDPEAYRYAIDTACQVLEKLPFKIRLLDIGGGYPVSYPGFKVPAIQHYWQAVQESIPEIPLAAGGEVLSEPGRALAAYGLSAVVEVLQRKGDRLYINDGTYGIFWELRFDGHDQYPVTVYRNAAVLEGTGHSFMLFGPTCDAYDVLPGTVELPEDIQAGDYLEFSNIGAYSLAGRTRFNQHFSDAIVSIGS